MRAFIALGNPTTENAKVENAHGRALGTTRIEHKIKHVASEAVSTRVVNSR